MNELISHMLGKRVIHTLDIQSEFLPIRGNPKALEEAVLHIALNALDAMPDGGNFTITLSEIEQAGNGNLPMSIPVGAYAEMVLADTGSGMDTEVRKQIFNPFFSTKDESIRTGLGLSVVQRIVDGMGGHILVESEPGKGTQFRLLFPLSR